MKVTLEFYIDETVALSDLDELSNLIRNAFDEAVGQTDYMVQDVHITPEIIDDVFF